MMDLAPPRTTKAIIDGALCAAASGETNEVRSPIDGLVFAELPRCGAEDLDRAVRGARTAFEDRRWQGMTPKARKKIMSAWAELVEAEFDELCALQSRDMGMPITMARNLEMANALDALRWYAEVCDKLYEEMVTLEDNVTALIQRTPLGVVGAILPWNAPAMIGAWKVGPALAAGNCVVLKPAEEASMVWLRLGELALQAGVPAGVLQVVPGRGSVIGSGLSRHMDVDALTFTGSGPVGRQIMAAAADSNLKRVSLELGGKSANIVMADAPDLTMAADVQVGFMFSNQGQVCEAPSRLLVQREIAEDFLAEVAARAAALRIGNPLDERTDMGPIVSAAQREAVVAHIDLAEADGGELILDGRAMPVPAEGYYLGASVIRVDDPHVHIAQEEVFGPVLTAIAFDTVDEAISIANATRYGLGAGLWSDSMDTIMYATRRLVAGNINVNGGSGPAVELPFGGFKESGFGRDRSLHAVDKFSDTKNIILRSKR
ncbi:MAG: aldehyde dehydrogenase family protein [Maritimibacter sp.]|nr:aldehyde dehydrogenase family protein [Maritimibacter sp.]